MNRIVETLQESQSLIESWGDVIDVTEFMTDTPGFFQANSLGVYTQIYDRADGRYRPVYTNESDLKIIRAMSWLLVERVPMAQAWINRLLDYTIGTGFDWTIKAEDKRLEKAIQAYVRETLDNSKWSSELERESYAREVGEGECILEHVYENGQCLAIACEADELTEPASKGELEDWIGMDFVPSWTFGVLTRENRPQNPIGYHFCRNQTGSDWDYVTADKVSHWKRNVRARAKRGFSDFYKPHLYLLRADRVLTNTAEGAATQAAIAYIVEHKDGTQRQADNIVKRFAMPTGRVDPMTGIMERKRKMKPGTRLDVPEGQTYKAGLLGANNSGIYIEVMEAALRLGGSVHAFVEGMLTGSYSNNNFASALVAEGPFMQGRLAEQSQRKERMREMILKMIRLGAGKRRFAAAGYDSWDSIRDAITVEVIPSRIVPMDPLKTSQALEVQKRNNWVSDKTCINELGRDIDTETANGLKVGGSENQAGVAGQPGAQTNQNAGPQGSDLGNVSKTEQEQEGPWLGLSTLQWRRNRKAITDVLTSFASRKMTRPVAKVLLQSIGMKERAIETILDDASDGQIDSMPQTESLTEAERKTLNKPFRTSGGPKKFSVYVKNEKGNVVKVNFGDPKMRIKRDDPGSRRGFRARHNCDNPGPKWKAKYWSCRMWSKPSVTKILKESFETGEIGWDGRTFVREAWLHRQNPRLLEVRCATGKGGGIDNSCKRKNKKPVNPKVLSWAKKKFKDETKAQKFAEWFGDSKVVDSNGEPLVVYKAMSGYDFNLGPSYNFKGQVIKPAQPGFEKPLDVIKRTSKLPTFDKADPEGVEIAGFFGGKEIANKFANNPNAGMDSIYPVFLKMEKPYVIDAKGEPAGKFQFGATGKPIRDAIRSNEYDGVIIENTGDEGTIHVALKANFIKSATGNKGTFNPDSNKINESFREAKDGDGDGLVDDGKPTQRAAEPKQPKAKKKEVAAIKPQKDEAGYKSKFGSLKTDHEAIRDQIQAAKKRLEGAKTHEETVEVAKVLQDLESQKYASAWNSATEYGAFHAENESEYRRLRGAQLDEHRKNQDAKNKLLIEWANEVKMRPRTDVSFSTLSMGADYYDEDSFDEKLSASYTINNSLETIRKYKGKFESIGEKKDLSVEINQAYFGEPDAVSSEVQGDGTVSLPSKINRGGADPSLKKFMETAAVAIQVNPEFLASIADKGVLSQSEGGKKGVASKKTGANKKAYLEVRQKIENDLFGLSDKDKRPIYGFLDNPARLQSGGVSAAYNYGTAQVILKPSIKSRTSYTIGDSLDDKQYGGKAGAVNDPSDHSSVPPTRFYSLAADAEKNPATTIAGESKNQFKVIVRSDGGTREKTRVPSYIEAQIHGGVQPSDIQEVRVPRGQITPAAKKKLEKAGISVVEIPPPPVENFYNIVPTWETVGND